MKILKLISGAVCLSILCGLGCSRSEITKAQVSEMFDKAGGVDKVNREAKIIFDRFGTTMSTNIYGQQLTNFPAISSLGGSIFLQTNSGWSRALKYPLELTTGQTLSSFSVPAVKLSFRMLQIASKLQRTFLSGNEFFNTNRSRPTQKTFAVVPDAGHRAGQRISSYPAAGMDKGPLSHAEVLKTAKKSGFLAVELLKNYHGLV